VIAVTINTNNAAAQQKQGGDTQTGPPAMRLMQSDPQLD
jgi:hypothetical protein